MSIANKLVAATNLTPSSAGSGERKLSLFTDLIPTETQEKLCALGLGFVMAEPLQREKVRFGLDEPTTAPFEYVATPLEDIAATPDPDKRAQALLFNNVRETCPLSAQLLAEAANVSWFGVVAFHARFNDQEEPQPPDALTKLPKGWRRAAGMVTRPKLPGQSNQTTNLFELFKE